jgi:hypothetical protein
VQHVRPEALAEPAERLSGLLRAITLTAGIPDGKIDDGNVSLLQLFEQWSTRRCQRCDLQIGGWQQVIQHTQHGPFAAIQR